MDCFHAMLASPLQAHRIEAMTHAERYMTMAQGGGGLLAQAIEGATRRLDAEKTALAQLVEWAHGKDREAPRPSKAAYERIAELNGAVLLDTDGMVDLALCAWSEREVQGPAPRR